MCTVVLLDASRLMLTLLVEVTCLVVWLCVYLHSSLEDHLQEVTYDWSSPTSDPVIQWAAFFSDVEHEILPLPMAIV